MLKMFLNHGENIAVVGVVLLKPGVDDSRKCLQMFPRIITTDQMMLGGLDEELLLVCVNDGLEQPVSSSSERRFSAVVLTLHTSPCSRAFKAKCTQNPAEPRTSSVVMETPKTQETIAART